MVLQKRVLLTERMRNEMAGNRLTRGQVFEAIFNAPTIAKTIRSKKRQIEKRQTDVSETLFEIKGVTFDSIFVSTQGKIEKIDENETVYVLTSTKRVPD
jgi:hypothetical protein